MLDKWFIYEAKTGAKFAFEAHRSTKLKFMFIDVGPDQIDLCDSRGSIYRARLGWRRMQLVLYLCADHPPSNITFTQLTAASSLGQSFCHFHPKNCQCFPFFHLCSIFGLNLTIHKAETPLHCIVR